ncbi:MAG: HlyD family efflux transporter periplasmic adaptor subunit [Phycisphaerales bacterium]|nr:HlyD family efflux transporter periplasmic adaptor subunit [Phycisphaerales bacterium]
MPPFTRLSRSARRGVTSTGVIVAAGATLIMIGAAWMVADGGGSAETIGAADLYTVEQGEFEITIPASGELAALEQFELRCELEGDASVLWIIEEGATVSEGDLLFKLDDEAVRERIQGLEEEVVSAQNIHRNREASLEIAQETRKSELQVAQVKVDQAELAMRAWEEGEVRTTREGNELAVRTAEKDYSRLKDKYEKSLQLREKDFISQDELETDEINVIKAEAKLSEATLARDMYEKYTYFKEQLQKESDRDQAIAEKTRTQKRTDATVRSAEEDVAAASKTLESKQERLTKWETQLERCIVRAPADGMVVYGSTVNRRRWDDQPPLQVGTKLYRNQLVMVLPNTERMAANVKVNEALSGRIEADQTAVLRTDAIPDAVLEGNVLNVGVMAEDGGWRDPNRRDYRVQIGLTDGHGLILKPSMRVKANIHVDTVTGVLFVPVQAIHRRGRHSFVYKLDGNGYVEHPVRVDRNSELFAEITQGLTSGDQVLLVDPPAGTVTQRLEDTVGGPPPGSTG